MLPRGIQTRISLTLLALLLTSMVLVDLVLLMVLQNQFLLFEGERADHFLSQFEDQIRSNMPSEKIQQKDLFDIFDWLPIAEKDSCLALMAGKRFVSTGNCLQANFLKANTIDAIELHRRKRSIFGQSWVVFGRGPQFLCTSMPLELDGKIVGGIGLMRSLDPFYSILRRSQKIFIFYLLTNVVLLSIGGYYLISRIFMRPIKRLADRAQQYEDDDELLFSVRLEDGELNKLSTALNKMMNRISKDREKLRENVNALETANDELKKAQKEVVKAEKLASVGRLSAGIAHEIGNPIGIILGYIELLKSEDQSESERRDCLNRAEAEILRINSIIRQLLDLSRPIPGEPKRISIHAFLKELIESVKVQPLFSNTELSLLADAPRDLIIVDPNHLRQVCLNLLINAADAVKSSENVNSGVIQIQTDLMDLMDLMDHPQSETTVLPSTLAIRFSDNGVGILESEMGNIFDPFYTTKDPGKGTGLGLSVSMTIVDQMGGRLFVESQYGSGTCITICLPLADESFSQNNQHDLRI